MSANRDLKDGASTPTQNPNDAAFLSSFWTSLGFASSTTPPQRNDKEFLAKLTQIISKTSFLTVPELSRNFINCNLLVAVKNAYGEELCSLLAYTVGFNPANTIYEPALDALLQCPNLLLTPFCEKNLYYYPVKMGNVALIKKLQAFGIPVTPQIMADCFNNKSIASNDFSTCAVNINDETMQMAKKMLGNFEVDVVAQNAEINLEAFKQLLNGGQDIHFHDTSVTKLFYEYKNENEGPSSIIAKILELKSSQKSELLKLVIDEIKIVLLSDIENSKIRSVSTLNEYLDNLAGNKEHENYPEIRKILEQELFAFAQSFLEKNDNSAKLPQKINDKLTLRIALLNKRFCQQEEKEQTLLKQFIQEGNFGMVQLLVKFVQYPQTFDLLKKVIENERGMNPVDRIGIVRIMLANFNKIPCDREFGKLIVEAISQKDFELTATLLRHIQNHPERLLHEYKKIMRKNVVLTPDVFQADFPIVLKNILFGKDYNEVPKFYLDYLTQHIYLDSLQSNIDNRDNLSVYVESLSATEATLLFSMACIYYQRAHFYLLKNNALIAVNNFMFAAEFLLEYSGISDIMFRAEVLLGHGGNSGNSILGKKRLEYMVAKTFFMEAKASQQLSHHESYEFLHKYTTSLLYLLTSFHDYRELPVYFNYVKKIITSLPVNMSRIDLIEKIIKHFANAKSRLASLTQTRSPDFAESYNKFSQICANEIINLLTKKIANRAYGLQPGLQGLEPTKKNKGAKKPASKPSTHPVADVKSTPLPKRKTKPSRRPAHATSAVDDPMTQLVIKHGKLEEKRKLLIARLTSLSQTEADKIQKEQVEAKQKQQVDAKDDTTVDSSSNTPAEVIKLKTEIVAKLESECQSLESTIAEIIQKNEAEIEKLAEQRKLAKRNQDKMSARLLKTNEIRQQIFERNQKKRGAEEKQKMDKESHKRLQKEESLQKDKKDDVQPSKDSPQQAQLAVAKGRTKKDLSNGESKHKNAGKKVSVSNALSLFFASKDSDHSLKYAFKWFNHSFVHLNAMYKSSHKDRADDVNFYALLFHLARFVIAFDNALKKFDDAASEIKQNEIDKFRQILLHRGMLSVDRDLVFESSFEFMDLMKRQLPNLRKPHLTESPLTLNQKNKLSEMKINLKNSIHAVAELPIYQMLLPNLSERKQLDESIVRSIFFKELAPTLKRFYSLLASDQVNANIHSAIASVLFVCGELWDVCLSKKGEKQASIVEDATLQNYYSLLTLCKEFRNKAAHEMNLAVAPYVLKSKTLFEKCCTVSNDHANQQMKIKGLAP